MVLARLVITLAVVSASFMLAGSHQDRDIIDPILSQYYIEPETEAVMRQVADRFEVVRRESQGFVVIVPQQRADELRQLVPHAQLQLEDIRSEILAKAGKNGTIEGYRTFAEVTAYLEQLQATYPDLVKLDVYGYSRQGQPLYALKISDHVASHEEDEPELMLSAATHGDELITVEVLLGLIQRILDGYGSDERMTSFVDDAQLYFLPVVNPDGFVRRSRYANGIDPNRDYPWPERPEVSSVECIANLRDFYQDHNFVGTMDFHASGMMIMYPWAYTYDRVETEDDRSLDELTTLMASTNGYAHGPISRVIYVAKGSSADYYYWQNKASAIAIELGRSKVPSASRIEDIIDENAESTWIWIESLTNAKRAAH